MTRAELEYRLKIIYAIKNRESENSLNNYLNHCVIDCRPNPQTFGKVAEPWQRKILERPVAALEDIAGIRQGYTGPRRFMRIMPRGHDKSSGIARLVNGLLVFSKRPLSMCVAAADSDQAGLIRDFMETEARLNPWFGSRLTFNRKDVQGPGGKLMILASDAKTVYGRKDHLTIFEEVTNWENEKMWTALYTGTEKVPGSVTYVVSNAGVLESWQHNNLLIAKAHPEFWDVIEVPPGEHWASWMDAGAVERMRAFLSDAEGRRVLRNEWIDPAEETGFLSKSDIFACGQLGRDLGLRYREQGESDRVYFGAIDYGPKNDRTVATILHRAASGIVVVDRMDVRVRAPEEREVPITWVENWINEMNEKFNLRQGLLIIDPFQMLNTIQRYELHQRVERFEAAGGKKNYEMAEALRGLIVNRQIAWYPDCGLLMTGKGPENLEDELRKLVLKPMPYGYRFDHELTGHDDRSCSLGMAALYACRDFIPTWVAPPTLKPMVTPRSLYGAR